MTKSELRELIRECIREELSNRNKIEEAVSLTYQATYDRLAKKFEAAIQDADKIWAKVVIDLGYELGYYSAVRATKLTKAAVRNITVRKMSNVAIDILCETGDANIDSIFSNFIEQEGTDFDARLGDALYYENFICYNDGTYEYVNLMEDMFTGNENDIECIIGIDYASGANIVWIRGEDDIKDLTDLLDI